LSRSVYFPREVLILSTAVSKLVEFLFEILIVIIIIFIFHFQAIPSSLVFLPLLVFLQLILVIGLMFPVAVISVLFHDVQHALPIVIMSLFYLSPVFYNVEMIPEPMRPFYNLNPFVGIMKLYHQVLYEGVWPSMQLLGEVSILYVAIFLLGYWFFRRYKGVCVEIA
jgi:ABC-type polysaccharide/polyol phosphate export permease